MNMLRQYFRETLTTLRKIDILGSSAFFRAGRAFGITRWNEFRRGQTMILQRKALVLELVRIRKEDHGSQHKAEK